MTRGARSAITLCVLVLGVIWAAIWGWNAATEPLPEKVSTPLCETRDVSAGSKIYPQDVTVSVYNSGTREGLASRTLRLLHDQGFANGTTGNTGGHVNDVEI